MKNISTENSTPTRGPGPFISWLFALSLTAGCTIEPYIGDTVYQCQCDCRVCYEWRWDCDEVLGEEICYYVCVDDREKEFMELVCGASGDILEAQRRCLSRCGEAIDNELECVLPEPPEVLRDEACEESSTSRAMANQSRSSTNGGADPGASSAIASQSPRATRAVINPAFSSYYITVDGETSDSTANGELYFTGGHCPGEACDVTVTWLVISPLNMAVGDMTLMSMQLINNGEQSGEKAPDDTFLIYPLSASFNASGYVDGAYTSNEVRLDTPLAGEIDYAEDQVIVAGTLADYEYGVIIDLYLVADIEQYPPIARAGDDQSSACGEPVILDATGSIDLDGTISSYTWYSDYKTPNQKIVGVGEVTSAVLPQGQQSITLVVADDDRLFGVDTITVDVGEDFWPPSVEPDGELDLVYGELVKEYFVENGFLGPAPESTSITLADCVGKDHADDECAGSLSLEDHGNITRIEMRLTKTSDNARAYERKLKMLLRHPFFGQVEYDGFGVTDGTDIELPIGQPPLPPLSYRVFFDVSDLSSNSASASCEVRLLSELDDGASAEPAVEPQETCVLCIGEGCPVDCLYVRERISPDASEE